MGALLSGGALPDAPDVAGVTAMMAAAAHGHIDCMDVLLGFDAGKIAYPLGHQLHTHNVTCSKQQQTAEGFLQASDRVHVEERGNIASTVNGCVSWFLDTHDILYPCLFTSSLP